MSQIGQNPDDPVAWFGVVTNAFDVVRDEEWDWHWHEQHELLWGTRGSLVVECRDGVRAVPWSVGLWIPAGEPHRVMAGSGTQFSCTYLAPELCEPPRADVGAVGVTPAVRALLSELRLRDLDPETRALAERVAVRMLDVADLPRLDLPLPVDDRTRRIADAVLADPADVRTLEQWGAVVGASERNLSRLFRRDTGMSFADWRTRARLRAAVELLAMDQPVAVVARRIGYGTTSAFVQAFRRELGITPGTFANAGGRFTPVAHPIGHRPQDIS
ncbi:AraC family transcriptional regulator [Microbacterium sp. No. 7]|uniref:AraC family transcriptional regulator n=1 Tax=Microbacterium sp. No. 7 TaxID=1714373 RepID=UPI0006CF304D|nr:AraC family transcriptional regulator [Microbacterium sp. No. 7]ALJ18559.1 hypothetical protein AOA12_00980 [Microbacterium sp. No. 7]